VKRQTVIDVVL